MARIGEQVFMFDPDDVIEVRSILSDTTEHMLTAQDWDAAREYVIGARRAPLIETLLANASAQAEAGNRRGALVEAVTALEVALGEFARNNNTVRCERLGLGVEADSVKTLIEKVGLRGSFGVVIPLLFDEQTFPVATIKLCRAAIEQRNNVVHQGQRDVSQERLFGWIAAIKEACRVLSIPPELE